MKKHAWLAVLAVGVIIPLSSQVQAHHAFAMEFSVDNPVELHGTISKVELINPHSWIHVDVKAADGTVTTWMIEGGSPNALVRRGVTKQSVPVGAEVNVTGYQARDKTNKAVGRNITFADGRELFLSDGTGLPAEQPK